MWCVTVLTNSYLEVLYVFRSGKMVSALFFLHFGVVCGVASVSVYVLMLSFVTAEAVGLGVLQQAKAGISTRSFPPQQHYELQFTHVQSEFAN